MKAHMTRIAAMGCLICKRPAEVHHVRRHSARDDRYVAPLCPEHHRGTEGIHMMGRERFADAYGVDLDAWAAEQWAKSTESTTNIKEVQ